MGWDFRNYQPNDAFKGGGKSHYKAWVREHRDLAILRARLAGRSRKEVADYWGLSVNRVTEICAKVRWKFSLKLNNWESYGIPEHDPILDECRVVRY